MVVFSKHSKQPSEKSKTRHNTTTVRYNQNTRCRSELQQIDITKIQDADQDIKSVKDIIVSKVSLTIL